MLPRRAWVVSARRPWATAAAFASYLLVAFLYFGLPLLIKSGGQFVAQGPDANFFVWALAWWPHAILHGQNPFFSHAVWAPEGINLMWVTSVPGLALVFSPLTLIAGPVAAYNVAAILMPALAAWTAFLLCRYLTNAFWPSLVGGYLFGFSSYVMERGGLGQLNMTAVFLVPLIALVVLRFLDGKLTGIGVIVRLGLLIAFQLLLSTEITFTLTLALVAALTFCFAFVPARRARIRSLLPFLAGGYALAAVLTEPFLYYVVAVPGSDGLGQNNFVADLANFVVPTSFSLVAGDSASALVKSFPDIGRGQEAYIGLPALVVIGLLIWERRRVGTGRFFLACFVVALIAPLGGHAAFLGHRLTVLPWDLVRTLPVFEYIQTARFAMYLSLFAGVAMALWITGRPSGQLRYLLPALAVLAIAVDPIAGAWATNTNVPRFFTDSAYRTCLDPGETILPLPIGQGSAMLWQAEDDFRFDMAGGYIGPFIPTSFVKPSSMVYVSGGYHLGSAQTGIVRAFIARYHVTTAVVDQDEDSFFSGALNRLATPQAVGGVVLYRFSSTPTSCTAGS